MSERIYRVDKFVVPTAFGKNFLAKCGRLTRSSRCNRFPAGFRLGASSGPGEFNFVTIVEWASQEAVENARAAVVKLHREMNFNAQGNVPAPRHKGDLAYYRRLET